MVDNATATAPLLLERPRWSRMATIEGYLSLALVGLMFSAGALQVWFPAPYGFAVGVSAWGIAWLLAISGVRRGRGGARVAASISLGILVVHAGLSLVIAYH